MSKNVSWDTIIISFFFCMKWMILRNIHIPRCYMHKKTPRNSWITVSEPWSNQVLTVCRHEEQMRSLQTKAISSTRTLTVRNSVDSASLSSFSSHSAQSFPPLPCADTYVFTATWWTVGNSPDWYPRKEKMKSRKCTGARSYVAFWKNVGFCSFSFVCFLF